MKEKFCLLGALLTISITLNAAEAVSKEKGAKQEETVVILPSKNVLASKLKKLSHTYAHFIEKTGIDEMLGGRELCASGVALGVELALYDYDKCLPNLPQLANIMQTKKSAIIKCILQDFPEALKDFEAYEKRLAAKNSKDDNKSSLPK